MKRGRRRRHKERNKCGIWQFSIVGVSQCLASFGLFFRPLILIPPSFLGFSRGDNGLFQKQNERCEGNLALCFFFCVLLRTMFFRQFFSSSFSLLIVGTQVRPCGAMWRDDTISMRLNPTNGPCERPQRETPFRWNTMTKLTLSALCACSGAPYGNLSIVFIAFSFISAHFPLLTFNSS